MASLLPVVDNSLAKPRVAQAIGNQLTLQKPDGVSGITVELAPLPNGALHQPATLHVYGEQTDGSPFWLNVADGEPVTEVEIEDGWRRDIPWEALQQLKPRRPLVFVFQAGVTSGECPVLFPPLTLDILELYEDRTTFSAEDGTDDWNGWMRGPAAQDPRDFIVETDSEVFVLHNHTYTSRSAGTVLQKHYPSLEVGRTYEFGLTVRRWNNYDNAPKFSLISGSEEIAPPLGVPTTQWTPFKGTFTALSPEMDLQIVSHVSSGSGNDYAFREIWLRTL